MKPFRSIRAPFSCLKLYQNAYVGRTFSASSFASSGRSIEVPTSQTTNERITIPTISTCPAPTCPCGETPTDLDIDRTKPLRGLMPRYTCHIVIRTGQDDWESKIEDGTIESKISGSESRSNLARELKELIGPKGKYYNNANFLVTNSSFDSLSRFRGRSVSIYPEGYTVLDVGETPETLEEFVKQFLIPSGNSEEVETPVSNFRVHEADNEPTILICGHNGRDRRCGVMGPLLRDEFRTWTYRQRTKYHQRIEQVPEAATTPHGEVGSSQKERQLKKSVSFKYSRKDWEELNCSIKVGLISHIGGHAWAGNVIIYLPPQHRLNDGSLSPLAGKGVWYGRVEPKHVEGIMEETVGKGRVIEELLRGVHGDIDVT